MDTRKVTMAGVLYWTPAPAYSSTPSSVISEDEWEHEEEEQAEKEDDFASQVDDDGIIGLLEEVEDVELGKTCGDADTEFNDGLNLGPPTPVEADSSESERELSYNRRDQSYIELPEEEEVPSQAHEVNKDVRQKKEEQMQMFLPESRRHLDIPVDVDYGKKTERSVKSCPVESDSAHLLVMEDVGVSDHHCPVSQPSSSVTTFPHLLHFTAEETSAAPGIEAETLPSISSSEGIQDSSWSTKYDYTVKLPTSPQSAAMFSDIVSDGYSKEIDKALIGMVKPDEHHKQPTHSPGMSKLQPPEATYSITHCLETVRADSTRQTTSSHREYRSSGTRRKAAKVHEVRKEPVSYPTPDFSKVKPRVHFPKGGYMPPKSRSSFKRESLSPEPHLVFKSHADIVNEVLLNATDESPAPSDSFGPPSAAPHSVLPQEFRCQQQDITLFNQLQEEHIKTLIKLAEAENTIDCLRQEAKVNLYSDPPKPGYLVQSELNKKASKVLMPDFPQAQRAEINSASPHLSEESRHHGSSSACPFMESPGPQVRQQLAQTLFCQAEKLLQQLQTFKDLLKRQTLKPVELMKLAKGLDSLEKSYLSVRDQHKLLQQQEADIGHFDPEGELEGLVFQCGRGLEELREQVKQMQQEELSCEVPLSHSPHHTSSSAASTGEESHTHPKSPPIPPLVNEREAAGVKEDSPSQENKKTLNSLHPDSLDGKLKCLEQDVDILVDHNQSLKELQQSHRDGAPRFAAPKTDEEEGERQAQGKINPQLQILPQRRADNLDSPPVTPIKQRISRSSPPLGRVLSQSTSPPVPCPSNRRSEETVKSHSSSLSSLGEITASERRNSRLQTQIKTVLSQDGIISPEMDSGFVGSESSHLTPAAATSPVHQGEPISSMSVPQEGNSGTLQTGPVRAPCPASSLLHNQAAVQQERGSQLSPDLSRRNRQGQRRHSFSSSLQHQICRLDQSRAESGTSKFWSESDSSVHVDRFNDGSISSFSSFSSSPAAYHHQAPASSQVGDPSASVQTLRAELSRLEKVDNSLKKQNPKSFLKTTPSAQENYTHIYTSTPHDRSDELERDCCRERSDGPPADDVGESTRATNKRPTSAHSESSTPLVSRSTQTFTAARDRHTSRTQSWQHSGGSETADILDSRRCTAPFCPHSVNFCRGQPENVGSRELPHSSHCRHCLLCEHPKHNRRLVPDCRRVSDSTKHTMCQTAQPLSGAPPATLHVIPPYPPPLLMYSLPLYNAPIDKRGPSSGGRGHEEVRVGRTHSLSVDSQLYVDNSLDRALDRAIRAARCMKSTSGHMAYLLAEGLVKQS